MLVYALISMNRHVQNRLITLLCKGIRQAVIQPIESVRRLRARSSARDAYEKRGKIRVTKIMHAWFWARN